MEVVPASPRRPSRNRSYKPVIEALMAVPVEEWVHIRQDEVRAAR